jgi:hypothetical protein
MLDQLSAVSQINRAVTIPFIQKKTGLKVISQGANLGEIVTEADKKVSQYFLDGGLKDIVGVRLTYPGSFSEESDAPARLTALDLYQNDPIDGTGDMVKTYQTERVMGPTTLISRLQRPNANNSFMPKAGMIYDILGDTAIVSDGSKAEIYRITETGELREVKWNYQSPEWSTSKPIRINKRVSYPQNNFDQDFINFIRQNGLQVIQVETGGAGIAAMQLFRSYMQPDSNEVPAFSSLMPIDILFNAQPDWKTWDTDPSKIIGRYFGLQLERDIYGQPLTANAAAPTLKEMHHKTGCVLSTSRLLEDTIAELAVKFERKHPEKKLTAINY